jgi:Mrp family chromosome partitioning ATPase
MNLATKRAQSTLTLNGNPVKTIPPESKDTFPVVAAHQLRVPDEAVRVATKLRAQLSKQDQIILFAGINERNGVAALASQVAQTLMHLEKECVLVVDADISRPSVHDRYSMPLAPGLSDVVAGSDVFTIAKPVADGSLYVLPAGNSKLDVRDLFTSAAFQPWLETLRAQFRFVILNIAPVLTDVAASLICPMADGVVLAARTEKQRRSEVQAARNELKSLNTRVLGIVLFEEKPENVSSKSGE